MKYFRIPFYCLLSAVMFFSCKKFLKEQSQSEIIPKTVESLNELLLGSGYPLTSRPLHPFTALLDDDKENIKKNDFTMESLLVFGWQSDYMQKVTTVINVYPWGSYYKMIQICNVALDYLPQVSGSAAEKQYVEGQAKLLRAYYYFQLVNFYGKPYTDEQSAPQKDLGVPLILKSGVSLESLPRNTVAEVYEQISKDIKEGILLLQNPSKNRSIFRINALAGQLLSSRVNLHLGNWQQCIDDATAVIAQKPDVANLSNWGAPNPAVKTVTGSNSIEAIWAFGAFTDVVMFGRDALDYAISADLLSHFETNDLRNGIYFTGKKQTKLPLFNYYGSTQIFRVSEAYLNRAEAYAQLFMKGNAAAGQKALEDLNFLRKNRFSPADYQPLQITDATELLTFCREEKRREFFNEEQHRWFDLRRYGMPEIKHIFFENKTDIYVHTLKDHDPAYLLPIHNAVLLRNPKIVQNPLAPTRKAVKL